MKKFIRIGVDLGKNYFPVHALASEDGQPRTRKLSRQAMRKFFSGIDRCLVGIEACAPCHYWARELIAMGHGVRLIPPLYVKPYVKRGPRTTRPRQRRSAKPCRAEAMRFVPVKSAESQAMLMLHRTRELLVKQKTMSVNALRSHLAEFGIIVAKGIGRVDEPSNRGKRLRRVLALAEADATLPHVKRAAKFWRAKLSVSAGRSNDLEAEIAAAHEASEMNLLLVEVPGIGRLIATALAAHMPDPGVFEQGRVSIRSARCHHASRPSIVHHLLPR
jgi:transposase